MCASTVETPSVDRKSHMILLRHELPLSWQRVWTGITRQISMTSRKLGKRSCTCTFHALDSHRNAIKTSEIIISTLTLYVANIGIDVIILQASLNKYRTFASVRNSHKTLQLAAEKHSFLSKCRFTISCEHNNLFHLNFISKWQT